MRILLLPGELLILSKFDFRDPKDVPHPPYKYPRVNFLVFDDLVGSANGFKKGNSAINKLTISHRHLQCNLLFTTQYMKAIVRCYTASIETQFGHICNI